MVAMATMMLMLAALPTPARAATWVSCGGSWSGVDFTPGTITSRTTALVAVWQHRATSTVKAHQTTTRWTRITSASCSFRLNSTKDAPLGSAIPASTRTTTVSVRHAAAPNLIRSQVIGRSVKGRAITAYLVGDPKATITDLVLGEMHGNEPAGVSTAMAIVNGPTISGRKFWVIPTMNPDGYAAGTRKNAHGVDLNRNFSYRWALVSRSSGEYGGPASFSEPESRAMRDFLLKVRPSQIVSIHQPLYGVDHDGVKNVALYNALRYYLGLPGKNFVCSGVCHGSMVSWINHTTSMVGITVEYSASPSSKWVTFTARRGITFALGARYV